MVAHFPDDILIDIFLRLPVISILVSRSVCKRWLRLIQNPNFIQLHLNRPIDNRFDDNLLMLMKSRYEDEFVLSSYHYADVPLKLFSPSMASRDNDNLEMRLIGPINGLFCVTDSVELVVFNPATRQFKIVPYNPNLFPPTFDHPQMDINNHFSNVGFGFDPVSNDYKVVKFVEFKVDYSNDSVDNDDDDNSDDDDDDDNSNDDSPNIYYYKVDIYSLSSDTWRRLDCAVPYGEMFNLRSYCLFFNGAFHWLGGDDDDEDGDDISSILVFDLNEEAMELFELPYVYPDTREFQVYLSVLNESLAMIVHKEIHALNFFEIEVWVMTEYGVGDSWEQLFKLNDVSEVEKPLSFGKNEELLVEILVGLNAHLGLFNLKTSEIEEVYAGAYLGTLNAFRYRESLVSPN